MSEEGGRVSVMVVMKKVEGKQESRWVRECVVCYENECVFVNVYCVVLDDVGVCV